MNIHGTLTPKYAAERIAETCQTDAPLPLALSNRQALLSYFQKIPSASPSYPLLSYDQGETVVRSGAITEKPAAGMDFAQVPLGYILKGEIVVIKGEKATKRLGAGDFLGLFETSDWLATGLNRPIGDWTLVAAAETEVLYFDESSLRASPDLCSYLVGIARTDRVPQPLTTLPLLDWVASHTTRSRLADYAIVAHTHLLPNNFPLFRHLAHLVGFGRMYVLEKPYSTVPSVKNDLVQAGCEVIPVRMEPGLPYEFSVQKSLEILWARIIQDRHKNGFRALLLIDDGGDIWTSLPWERLEGVSMAGVEQTQRGIERISGSSRRIPPVVSVASSGIKKRIESRFIGISVVRALNESGLLESARIGVLGRGSIGLAVIDALKRSGKEPYYYDPSREQSGDPASRPSLDSLLNDSDLIIGTTGTDSLKGAAFERVSGHKVLASASSADVEFASILQLAPPVENPFSSRKARLHESLDIEILNGGYPINFDRLRDATPANDIVLTRCLMYIGAMQAVSLLESGVSEGKIYTLDKIAQRKLLERWIDERTAAGLEAPLGKEGIEDVVNAVSGGLEPSDSVWKE